MKRTSAILIILLITIISCKKEKNPTYEDRGHEDEIFYGSNLPVNQNPYIAPCEMTDMTVINNNQTNNISSVIFDSYASNYYNTNSCITGLSQNFKFYLDFMNSYISSGEMNTVNLNEYINDENQCYFQVRVLENGQYIYYGALQNQKIFIYNQYNSSTSNKTFTVSFCDILLVNNQNDTIVLSSKFSNTY